MKKFIFSMVILFMLAITTTSCNENFSNIFRNANNENSEVEFAKVYVVHKLEAALGIKIKFDTNFEAKTSLPISKIKTIFGERLVNKFSDSLHLTFENQKVKTQIAYIKIDDNNCTIAIKREPKVRK